MKNVWTKTVDSSSLLLFFFLFLFVVLWNGSPKIFLVLYLLQLWVYFGKTFLNLTLRMWFLSWSHPGELFCDLFEWALVFPESPWHWGRGRDGGCQPPSQYKDRDDKPWAWVEVPVSPQRKARVSWAHTLQTMAAANPAQTLSIPGTDVSQGFQHLSDVWILGIQTLDD